MKVVRSVQANAKVNNAFAKINSANGEELNKIVAIIEQHGREVGSSKNRANTSVVGKKMKKPKFTMPQ